MVTSRIVETGIIQSNHKIGVIAQAFGCTTGKIETSPCSGKWRGTSDISIQFDNGTSLFIGNHVTPKAKTAKVQNEYVDSALVRFNPEIISATKKAAIAALIKREAIDNAVAAQKGLKPYTVLNVEFDDGTEDKHNGYMGWYYVTLAVDGKICTHMETGLNYDIAGGKVSEIPTKENYYTAGALKEADAFAGLSSQEQSILILHCVLELPDQEIGRLVGMSRSAVQRRRTKSLSELRIKLMALMPKGG